MGERKNGFIFVCGKSYNYISRVMAGQINPFKPERIQETNLFTDFNKMEGNMKLKDVLKVVGCQIVIYDRKTRESISIGKHDRFHAIPYENMDIVWMDVRAVLNNTESSDSGFKLFTPYLHIEVEGMEDENGKA